MMFQRLHNDQSGAVAMLCLAGILMIMLTAWIVYDAGFAARDKVEVQASADTAAYSMSAVKARSMNMIAYANVAKRSIVGIHAVYMAGLTSYIVWWLSRCGSCSIWNPSACADCVAHGAILIGETITDFQPMTGILTNLFGNPRAALRAFRDLFRGQCNLGFLIDGGNTRNYHGRDLKAIDNYQLYTMGITPWWAFSEGVVRGMRNTGTTLGSWPAPGRPGDIIIPITNWLSQVSNAIGSFLNGSGKVDRFPLTRMEDFGEVADNIASSPIALAEKLANALIHRQETDDPSGIPLVSDGGRNFAFAATMSPLPAPASAFEIAMRCLYDSWEPFGLPFKFETFNNLGEWLVNSSYLVLAYNASDEKFNAERNKYNMINKDYSFQLGYLDNFTYQASGYWAFSKSEITYQAMGEPSPFVPGWSARLRPVSLPNEWSDGGASMATAYHDMLPWLAISSALNGATTGNFMAPLRDLVYMERTVRSLGQSTIDGVGK